MKTRPSLALALLSLLLLTACNKGTPLPGGYAVFIASGSEILLVDKQRSGLALRLPRKTDAAHRSSTFCLSGVS